MDHAGDLQATAATGDRHDVRRRDVLARLGWVGAGVGARGLVAGAGGGLLAGLLASPAGADAALDVQILQTASSVARLAVDTYQLVLTPGTVPNGAVDAMAPAGARDAIRTFLTTTRAQHAAHLRAFQAQTAAVGGVAQDAPNARFQQLMGQQVPGLGDAGKVVDFLAALEKVATDTYLRDVTMLDDRRSKELVAGAMAVDAQHLATLRVFGALLGSPELIALPFPQAGIVMLPGAVCARAFPDALHQLNGADGVADPASGAVR